MQVPISECMRTDVRLNFVYHYSNCSIQFYWDHDFFVQWDKRICIPWRICNMSKCMHSISRLKYIIAKSSIYKCICEYIKCILL